MRWDAVGVVLGIIGITFAAGIWVQQKESDTSELTKRLKSLEDDFKKLEREKSIPKGTVMAFDGTFCPEGDTWNRFYKANGRFILGAGSGTSLTPRKNGDVGGEEFHTINLAEMPKHSHSAKHAEWGSFSWRGGGSDPHWNKDETYESYVTGEAGDNQPHNNMPPFIALTYCIKT